MSSGEPMTADHRHETRDVNASVIFTVAGGMIVSAVLMHVSLYYVQKFLNERSGDSATRNPLSASRDQESLNRRISELPEPRLEGLRQLADSPAAGHSSQSIEGPPIERPVDNRPENQPQLHSYAWVDLQQGIARIPVDVAMSAALEMNLYPVQSRADVSTSGDRREPGRAKDAR